MRYIYLTFLLFILSGCIGGGAVIDYVFDSTKDYQNPIQYTKKSDMIDNEKNVKAFVIVTYLNQTKRKWDDDMFHFIVGFYAVDKNSTNYSLTINNKNSFHTQIVKKDTQLYQNIPIKNNWAEYNLIEIEKKDLNLTINDKIVLNWKKTDENISMSIVFEQF